MSEVEPYGAHWREVREPFWDMCYYYDWWTKDITWVLMEVLDGGGLQDLLQSQVWRLEVVNPNPEHIKKNPHFKAAVIDEWGKEVAHYPRGHLFVTQSRKEDYARVISNHNYGGRQFNEISENKVYHERNNRTHTRV